MIIVRCYHLVCQLISIDLFRPSLLENMLLYSFCMFLLRQLFPLGTAMFSTNRERPLGTSSVLSTIVLYISVLSLPFAIVTLKILNSSEIYCPAVI